ncbi:MAG: NCS2 family permease [Oscillospiraceae bacterium]|nr:NCS2 family permease [Oscillospiraceae bacterium]
MAARISKFFKLEQKGTTIRTEAIAGITTFATMAYILAVNPDILSAAGLDSGAVFVATALGAVIGTVCIALLANLPFAMAPGMGLNAFFAYTVVIGMGYTWQFALCAVFVEGLIFVVLSKSGIRTMLFNAIPLTLKYAVGAGIGMFIVFIGLKNAGVVVADGATFVALGNLRSAAPAIALIGVIITIVLLLKKVKGALLIGIIITWALGIIAQLAGWYAVDPAVGNFDLIPKSFVALPPSLAPTFGKLFTGFKEVFVDASSVFSFLSVMIAFLFVDIFDTVGTLAGVASKANMLNEKGELEGVSNALLSDSIATTVGAVLGTSTVTTYIESAAGVQEGGRTGLTSIVTSIFFLISLFLAPVFLTIPGFATATALIVVGLLMVEPIKNMKLDNLEELIPLGITIVAMPLFYSISTGLAFGFISYVVVKLATGKVKDISVLMWILTVVFLLQLVLAS